MTVYGGYSVLMSVYYKEKAEYLRESIESMLSQTAPTDDFVLVCDGPLTPELDSVIEEFTSLHVIRLPENKGLGNALNEGMKQCRHELIARMDSDDISRPDRCARELKAFRDHPEVDIVSGTIEEFMTSPTEVYSRRVLPETSEDIAEFAKKRNPFNHPAVMYRKSAVEAAGGYKDFYLLEDYFLWVRMLLGGSKGYNIKEPLLFMRAGSDLYKRRGGLKHFASEKRLFNFMLKQGFITKREYLRAVSTRAAAALIPNGVRGYIYKKVLRG